MKNIPWRKILVFPWWGINRIVFGVNYQTLDAFSAELEKTDLAISVVLYGGVVLFTISVFSLL